MTQALKRRVERLKKMLPPAQMTPKAPPDPVLLAEDTGISPDPWQVNALRSTALHLLLLASRQSGKSTVSALLALHTALFTPGSLVLLLSPTQRQSGELFRDKVLRAYNALGRPVPTVQQSQLQLELSNGSRIISLPGDEGTVRGYSGVRLLVIDEAARVADDLYRAVRPMLAVSGGRLIALSTPFGKRGFFFEEWSGTGSWERVQVQAINCPRISAEFLAEEKRSMGDRWFRQEYECSFEDTIDAVFSSAEIHSALDSCLQPLFDGDKP